LPAASVRKAGVELSTEYTVAVPGEVAAPVFGLRLRIERMDASANLVSSKERLPAARIATLRNWRPGDHVRQRYSSAPRKVKEVLERLKVTGSGRALWPVLELNGRIVWMQGVEVEAEPGISILTSSLSASVDSAL
jgi:tRNA(Ile)-lysidine synthase